MKKSYFVVIAAILLTVLAASIGGRKLLKKSTNLNTSENSSSDNQISQNNNSNANTNPSTYPATNEKTISLEILQPGNQSFSTSQTITVKGKTVPNAEVSVNDKDLKADSNGIFSVAIQLDQGENTIDIVANDENGNHAEKEITVSYEIK